MRIRCRGGPFDDRCYDYSVPLPRHLVLFDAGTLSYHQYVREYAPSSTLYNYDGYLGQLPVPVNLDAAPQCAGCGTT